MYALLINIGTLLHFEDHQLKMYYFLDPQWMAKLMARVIQPNSPAIDGEQLIWMYILHAVICHNSFVYCTGISLIDNLLPQCGIPDILQPIYLSLLEKFEVAMVTNQRHIIIPSLMPTEAVLPKHEQALDFSANDDLYQPPLRRFWYSDYISDGFWPRIICRIVKDLHIAKVH